MTITIETMPRTSPQTFADAERPDAPAWATRATTFCSGSLDTPQWDGDVRTWERPVGELEWPGGDFYDEGFVEVSIEQREVADGDGIKSPGPAVTLDLDWSAGIDFTRPEDVRRFAALLLTAADELERIQGA